MFKKTLLCAALVAVSGGALAKATGASTALIHSTEAAVDIASVAVAGVTMTLEASYVQGDIITLTYSQPLTAATVHGALEISDQSAGPAVVIPLTVLTSDANSVTYRTGAVPAAYNYAAAQTITIPTHNIIGSNQASGTLVTLSYAAATSTGQAIDSGTADTVVAEFWDQYQVDVTVKADALIDVENERKQFVLDAGVQAIDEDVITVLTSTTTAYTAALVGEAAGLTADLTTGADSTFTVNGDFSWLDTAAAGFAIDTAIGGLSATAGGADLVAGAGIQLAAGAVTQSSAAAAPTATLAIQTEKTVVQTAKTYTVDVVLKWNNAAAVPAQTKTFAGLAAGSWALNGANVTAYGVPNSPAVTPFLWVQNAGTNAGEITGTASCDGATIDLGALGSATGDTNTSVGPAVQAAITADGTCGAGSRYDVTLTVNAKASDVTITAGYKVTAADGSFDRLGLETSDSLN